jgi:hypothetical protein
MASDGMVASVGWSTATDAAGAGKEAADYALARLSPRRPALAIVFGSSWLEQLPMLEGVRSVIGSIPMAGESTAGEIVSTGPLSHSCVVALVASEALACGVGLGEQVDRDSREAGQQAAYASIQNLHKTPRVGCIFFGDGLVTTYAQVVRGLQEALGTSSLIVGGMAGDDLRFANTSQYFQNRVVSRSVVTMLLGGAVKIGVGIEHGFAPISKPRQITQSKANVLMKLDRKPAASVYEEYFGHELVGRIRQEGLTRQAIVYPLGIQTGGTDQWVLRNVVSFGADGSLSCSGEVLEGAWLQLMIGSRELALEAAHRAARQAIRSLNRIACVLVFDSVARRMLLGFQHAASEIARIREAVGSAVPLAGCYTYGEQAPFGTTMTYDQTATQTGSVLVVAIGI